MPFYDTGVVMKTLSILLADIPPGKNPEDALYARIKQTYPEVKLDQTNSHIDLIQAWPSLYNAYRTILRIKSNTDPSVVEEFYYNRFDVEILIKNPMFSAAELPALIEGTELDILEALGNKLGSGMTEQDFWITPHQFVSIGGSKPPNFRLKSRFNSPYWCGEAIVWLHR